MKVLLAGVFALLLCGVQCGPFTVKISTKSEYKFGDDIDCEVTISNYDRKGYYLLARNTPLEGLISATFSVSKNGKVIPYDSILMKRGPPSKEEYVFIKANSSLLSSVDLSEAYSFDSTGAYIVQLKTRLQFSEDKHTNFSTQLVFSNIEEFSLAESQNQPKLTEGQLVRRNTTRSLVSPLKSEAAIPPAFSGSGTSSDEYTGTIAYNAAYNTLYKSYHSVRSNPSLYNTWFGTAYSGFTSTVKGNYLKIKSAMETYRYTLYFHGRRCSGNTFAYTYYDATYIYLCDGYFSASVTGTDSKMGTIVHEMSHAVALTEDFEYGQRKCQVLAGSDPRKAINNADNYEYFSEAQ